jgi:hypothetical protein
MEFQGRYDHFFPSDVAHKLVEMIEKNADELTKNWLDNVKKHANTPTYGKYGDEAELYQRAYRVFSQLSKWISRDTSPEEIKNYWTGLGKQRRREGFALSEIVLAIAMVRQELWRKVQTEGLLDTAYDLYQAMELYNRVSLFFDKAVFFTAIGYENVA